MTSSNLIRSLALTAATLVTAANLPAQAGAQTSTAKTTQHDPAANIKADPSEGPESHNWTTEQIVTCTVAECWQLSGRKEDTFFDIVQDLAAMSAKKRNLVLPQSEAAGHQAGEMIKASAKADHDQLLYAVVDSAVRKIGTSASTSK